MRVAEPPYEGLNGAAAPAVLLPLAAAAKGGEAPPFSIPWDLAPAIPPHVPVASAIKPYAAFAVSIALHVCLVAGALRLAADNSSFGDSDLETPIEIVVGQTPEAGADVASAAQSDAIPDAAPSPAKAAEKPAPTDAAAEAGPAEQPAQANVREPPRTAAPAEPDGASPASEATGPAFAQAQQRARAREQARREAIARRAAERERLEAERATARRDAREKALAERRRAARAEERRNAQASPGERRTDAGVPRAAAGGAARETKPARVGDGDGFDAAAYRALVARAVRAAVGSRCSQAAGARVVIALTIGRAGAISSAVIASSSGNGGFDAASASAVRSAGPFPPPTGRAAVSVPVAVSCR